ncbi:MULTISPECIES: PIN domain-containing protein [unclassified Salinivibrio]|uniref:PIN domain-containing protein n=2 Tax=Salinivibrio TaxID=51366 RepID=UPI000986B6CB|nr:MULTISPECIES: PIN domain-containing protein [unclassified Salinivibrio]OOF11343.1 PIN domain-containing protein [Salinivibrio sp. PR5]OOF15687.1 PIN domain-containing protein [Salinivibrio sp. PR932]OOF16340.1 PIN domain-containing protein [Salinivibrio sp. PR919]
MTSYTVILDACVMYPAPLRSYLMYLSNTGLFRARWTEQIHDEWIRNLLKNNPDIDPERLERTKQLMNAHVPDCLIEGYEPLIDGLTLPDVDDRHVVAAAIKGQAESIITFNLKDFPSKLLDPLGLSVIHPDEFLCDMFELDSSACVRAAQQQKRALKNPPMTSDDFLACLQRQKLPSFVSKLRSFSCML